MDSVERGVSVRLPERGVKYHAFVDMSGGSNDDATLAIAHRDADGRAILDRIMDQGQRPPFDPRKAVERFVNVLKEYGLRSVVGDAYAGETFRSDFQGRSISYRVSELTKSEIYEEVEPLLNDGRIVLLDIANLESQLLGLVWRGGKIDHPNGEHADFANGAAGALHLTSKNQVSTRARSRSASVKPSARSYTGSLTAVHSDRAALSQVGLLAGSWNDWEYPWWVLLQQSPTSLTRLEHVQVNNPSAALADRKPFDRFDPCAIIEMQWRPETIIATNYSDKKRDEVLMPGGVYTSAWALGPVQVFLKKTENQ